MKTEDLNNICVHFLRFLESENVTALLIFSKKVEGNIYRAGGCVAAPDNQTLCTEILAGALRQSMNQLKCLDEAVRKAIMI